MANSSNARMVVFAPNQMRAAKQQGKILEVLKILLANEFVLCAKLRDYHCDSTNAHSYSLHAICESQADNIAALTHVIDERIRQYELCKSGLMHESIWKANLIEKTSIYPDARTMVADLITDHENFIQFLCQSIESIGWNSMIVGSVDLLRDVLCQHEEMAGTMCIWL